MTNSYFAKVDLQFNSEEECNRVDELLRENFEGTFFKDLQSITADLYFELPVGVYPDEISNDIRKFIDESVIPEGYIDIYEHRESYCIIPDGEVLV